MHPTLLFFVRLYHAQLELTRAWMIVLVPAHAVYAIALLLPARVEHFWYFMAGWLALTLFIAAMVLVVGIDGRVKPLSYVVLYWLLPLLACSLWHGIQCARLESRSIKVLSPSRIVEESKEEQEFLITARFQMREDSKPVENALNRILLSAFIGMLQFFASVLVATHSAFYVLFAATWLIQVKGEK